MRILYVCISIMIVPLLSFCSSNEPDLLQETQVKEETETAAEENSESQNKTKTKKEEKASGKKESTAKKKPVASTSAPEEIAEVTTRQDEIRLEISALEAEKVELQNQREEIVETQNVNAAADADAIQDIVDAGIDADVDGVLDGVDDLLDEIDANIAAIDGEIEELNVELASLS